jgi:RsmE family RNA methyltransferase
LNLILFEKAETKAMLAPDDPRATHLRDVLRLKPGGQFDVAAVNGPRGKATLVEDGPAGLSLAFQWEDTAEPDLLPLRLLAGLPRPQTARKILEQAAALGVSSIDFFGADKGEPSYAESKLWTTDEWRRHLIRGVEQAFCSFLPEVRLYKNLETALATLSSEDVRLALDVYEANEPLSSFCPSEQDGALLAVGPESGWSPRERELLRGAGFALHHLGKRVLRQETACVAALGLLAARSW